MGSGGNRVTGAACFPPAKSSATIAYMSAYELLSKGDSGASQAFAAVVGEYGDDPLATFHLQRLLAGETGVEIVLSEK